MLHRQRICCFLEKMNSSFEILVQKLNESLNEFRPRDIYESAYMDVQVKSLQEVEKKILEQGEPSITFEEMTSKVMEVVGGIHAYRIGFLKLRIKDGKLESCFTKEAQNIIEKVKGALLKDGGDPKTIADLGSEALNPGKKKIDELIN